jgi:hypothetical protein
MFGCKDDDSTLCFSPPTSVIFGFLDSEGNNLIENGSLKLSDIKIKEIIDEENELVVEFSLREDYRISLNNIGWYDGIKNYTFSSPLIEFGFIVKSSEITGDCSGYKIEEIDFVGMTPVLGDYGVFEFIVP